MIASIITPEDIRSAFTSLIIITCILGLVPLIRLKDFSLSANTSLAAYSLVSLWSWFIYSDAGSSACPEYSAYLWPLFATVLGVVYLAAHTCPISKALIQKVIIAVLSIWMAYLSDWNELTKVAESYKMANKTQQTNR